MKKLNVGCGKDIREKWDNLDTHTNNGANIVHDLNNLPLPFEDNTYDYVLCSHVIEDWLNPLPLLQELVRITKVKGLIEIRVPHQLSANAWGSLVHKQLFNNETLVAFITGKADYKEGEYTLPVEVILCENYANINWRNPIVALYKIVAINIRNFFKSHIERVPIFRNISTPDMSIKCIYKKIK